MIGEKAVGRDEQEEGKSEVMKKRKGSDKGCEVCKLDHEQR